MSEISHTSLIPNQMLTPPSEADGLRVVPYVSTWGEYEYRTYEVGRERCFSMSEALGGERFSELVSHVLAYAAGPAYAGEDFQRTAVGYAFMLLSADRGRRPDHESNMASYRQLRYPSIANTTLQLYAHATNLAQVANYPVAELPAHFASLKYGQICGDITGLTRSVVAGEFDPPDDPVGREDHIMLSAAQSTFTLRALLRTAAMSGDKNLVAAARDNVQAMLVGYAPHSSHTQLLTDAMQSRHRDFRPMVGTARMIGNDLPHAFRDFIYCETLVRTEQALGRVLHMKRREFEQTRDETRQALSFVCQPDVYMAIAAAAQYGTSPEAAAEFTEHLGTQGPPETPESASSAKALSPVKLSEAPSPDSAANNVVSSEAGISPAAIRERLEGMITQWSSMEILGETHEKTGLKRAAEKLQRDITHLKEQGRAVPNIDVGRLEMIASLKEMWPGAQVVSGIFTGRRKQQTTTHEGFGDDEVDMLKSYIALVLPIVEDGQYRGEYVVAENLVAGRNATYVYLSLAGNNRPWTEVFGPKKKGVSELPGVKVLQHSKVGTRSASQATFEKLRYILAAPHDQYEALNFSGESRQGALRVRIGTVALKSATQLELPNTKEGL